MKLRVTQEGFEGYTGQMGVVFFEDGLSVGEVSQMDATRMSAVMKFEWEDHSASNVAQIYLDNMNTAAPMFEVVPVNEAVSTPVDVEPETLVEAPEVAARYTEEQLEAIADEQGIAGLREIADPLDIKSNSITGLIDAIKRAITPNKKAE